MQLPYIAVFVLYFRETKTDIHTKTCTNFKKFISLVTLFYFWLCWVFVASLGLSLVAASGGFSSLRCAGFSLWWLLLLRSMGSRRVGSVVVAHGL